MPRPQAVFAFPGLPVANVDAPRALQHADVLQLVLQTSGPRLTEQERTNLSAAAAFLRQCAGMGGQ